LFSGGIPRLINIICDNALLLAYADGKKTVTREVVQEVARDLALANRSASNRRLAYAIPDICDADLQTTPATSSGLLAVSEQHRRSRSLAWIPMGMVLTVIGLGGAGGALYSQQIKEYLGQEPSSGNRRLPPLRVYQNRSVTFQSREPDPSLNLGQRVTPVQAKPQDLPKNPDAQQTTAPNPEQSQPQESSAKKRDSRLGTFEVVGHSSFVRGSPRAEARIIAQLEPSTRIKVISAKGDYLQVQAVFEGKPIRGYVHREDAFFERPQKDKRPNGSSVVSGVN
jgi:hypothetical protein